MISQKARTELLNFTVQLNPSAATPYPDSVHFWVTGWKTPGQSVVYGGYCQLREQYGKRTAILNDWQFAGKYESWRETQARR